jgi:hypothetical protein
MAQMSTLKVIPTSLFLEDFDIPVEKLAQLIDSLTEEGFAIVHSAVGLVFFDDVTVTKEMIEYFISLPN